MKCLVVDDEPGIREGLGALLRLKGHEVRTAADVAAALALLRATPFDAVVTDWRLPDGDAAPLLEASPCPVVAMSGHPEEVMAAVAPFAVLGKPVAPAALLDVLVAAAAAGAAEPPAPFVPSRDAQEVLDRALALLGDPPAATIACDATFAVLRAPLADDRVLAAVAELGGDLRVLAPEGAPEVELRVCRDGRPDPGLPVFAPGAEWPPAGECRELAVDFADFAGGPAAAAELACCLDRAAAHERAGGRVHFCNVAPELLRAAAVSAGGRAVPMRAKVGPRLPAVLVDLWSGS